MPNWPEPSTSSGNIWYTRLMSWNTHEKIQPRRNSKTFAKEIDLHFFEQLSPLVPKVLGFLQKATAREKRWKKKSGKVSVTIYSNGRNLTFWNIIVRRARINGHEGVPDGQLPTPGQLNTDAAFGEVSVVRFMRRLVLVRRILANIIIDIGGSYFEAMHAAFFGRAREGLPGRFDGQDLRQWNLLWW